MSKNKQLLYFRNMQAVAKTSVAISMLLFSLPNIYAQAEQRNIYGLTNVYHYIGVAGIEMVDPYLSVMEYSGKGIRYEYSSARFFDPQHPLWSSNARINGLAAMTTNPRSSASIALMGAGASWGVQYYYRNFEDILLVGGANMEVDFAYKMNSRNVNNPVNIDLSTNLNMTIGGRYFIHTKRRTLQLNAAFEFPVIGCMFVPYPGFSYYEMYSTKAYMDAVHFSSFHNKQGLKQHITIDIPLKHLTWSFGVRRHYMKYSADDQIYSYSELDFLAGITYDMIGFSGRKVKVPEIFISPKR